MGRVGEGLRQDAFSVSKFSRLANLPRVSCSRTGSRLAFSIPSGGYLRQPTISSMEIRAENGSGTGGAEADVFRFFGERKGFGRVFACRAGSLLKARCRYRQGCMHTESGMTILTVSRIRRCGRKRSEFFSPFHISFGFVRTSTGRDTHGINLLHSRISRLLFLSCGKNLPRTSRLTEGFSFHEKNTPAVLKRQRRA